MKKSLCRFVLLTFLILAGCDQLSEPRTFDDCILKNMKGVTSDHAAVLINRSCREKFPQGSTEREKSRTLTSLEIGNLTGRAGLSYGNHYSGSMYNGNRDITVTSVTIRVSGKLRESDTSRDYTVDVTIPPLSTQTFRFNIVEGDEGTEYSWSIIGARGYRT